MFNWKGGAVVNFLNVYVDSLVNNGWRLGPNCHLYVDRSTSLEVLHAFAASIGMRRAWFQSKPRSMPHYDLTASRRQAAIRLGAIEQSNHEMVAVLRDWRGARPLPMRRNQTPAS